MTYEKINSKVVRTKITSDRPQMARRGAMLAYNGQVLFRPVTMQGGPGGIGGQLGRAMAGERSAMMLAEGNGEIFYGYLGQHVTTIEMDGMGSLSVEADRLLAHDANLQTSVVFLGQGGAIRGAIRGAMTGQGLFTTQLSGVGSVAVLSHGGTIAIQIGQHPVAVDPQAYVGHVGTVQVDVASSLGARDLIGRGSGEAIQLKLTGQGTVYVQASEQKF